MPYTTAHLTPHEAIADTIHRFVEALDDSNIDLLSSAFTPDAVFDLSEMKALNPDYSATVGREAIVAQLSSVVFPMDTTHMVTNIRSRLLQEEPRAAAEGAPAVARRARVTAYALAQHWRPGQGPSHLFGNDFLNGNRYDADLVFDGEVWRFERFRLRTAWAKGDRGVFDREHWERMGEFARQGLESGRGRS